MNHPWSSQYRLRRALSLVAAIAIYLASIRTIGALAGIVVVLLTAFFVNSSWIRWIILLVGIAAAPIIADLICAPSIEIKISEAH